MTPNQLTIAALSRHPKPVISLSPTIGPALWWGSECHTFEGTVSIQTAFVLSIGGWSEGSKDQPPGDSLEDAMGNFLFCWEVVWADNSFYIILFITLCFFSTFLPELRKGGSLGEGPLQAEDSMDQSSVSPVWAERDSLWSSVSAASQCGQ